MINELAKRIHETAKSKGFYEGDVNIGEKLCLIHSEVSEALECDRKKPAPMEWHEDSALKIIHYSNDDEFKMEFEKYIKDTFADELADIMIRVMDLGAFKNIDLEAHIRAKMRYNALREHKHGKNY